MPYQPEPFLRDDSAATAVEYALMIGLIALVIVGAVTVFGEQVVALYNNISLHMALGGGS
jgi:pilus assembly protein Flp/PilA